VELLRDWYRYQPIPESVAELSIPAPPMRNVWARDNATHLQSPDDSERCGRAYIGDRLYGRCMKSKGWRRIDVRGRPGYPRRGGVYTVP